MAVVQVACVRCSQTESVVKNGKTTSGHQRYLCRNCKKSFQLDYSYNANQQGTHECIIDMTMNGSGVRDIGRVLKNQSNDSYRSFKKLSPRSVTQFPFENVKAEFLCEVDKQWSFVGNKKNQHWLFYAWEHRFKRVIAHAFGRRSGKTLKKVAGKLKPYKISYYCTQGESMNKIRSGL